MRRLVFFSIVIAAFAWPAVNPAFAQSQGERDRPARGECAWIRLLAEDGGGRPKPTGRTVSASEILDVVFRVHLLRNDLEGTHLLELELYTPNGNLYQVLTEPITTDAAKRGESVIIEGHPKPKSLQVMSEDDADLKRLVAKVSFPVAGTLIVSNSLYGRWEVRTVLDGTPVTCPERVRFNIEP
jgi:hypothetical protein